MRLTIGVLLILMFAVSVSAQFQIPDVGEGHAITGVGIQTGDPDVQATVSCVQGCVEGCVQGCQTTSCAQACGENCAAKCISGTGITSGGPITVPEPDIAAYCGAATTCDQCRNRPAYRCVWAGACVPCTGASCIISCGYVPKKTITKITNIVDEQDSGKIGTKDAKGTLDGKDKMPYVKDPKEEDFILDPKTGELVYIGDLNETELDRLKRPNYYKYSDSTIAKIFRGIGSFFSWIFS